MNPELAFDSIESAHEFVALVSKVALETKRDIDADIEREMTPTASRRVNALQIVAHKLGTLELHLTQTRRILNDLRSRSRNTSGPGVPGFASRPPCALSNGNLPLRRHKTKCVPSLFACSL